MGIELEVIQDKRIMDTINSAKRGGLSLVIQRLCMTKACGEYYKNSTCERGGGEENERGRKREREEEEWGEEEGEGEFGEWGGSAPSTSILYLGKFIYIYTYIHKFIVEM